MLTGTLTECYPGIWHSFFKLVVKVEIATLYFSVDWPLSHVPYPLASCCSFTLSSHIVVGVINWCNDGWSKGRKTIMMGASPGGAHQMTIQKKCSLSGQSCSWFCNSTFSSVKLASSKYLEQCGGWRNEGGIFLFFSLNIYNEFSCLLDIPFYSTPIKKPCNK